MLYGLIISFSIAGLATLLGQIFPIAGSAIISMAIGILLNNTVKPSKYINIDSGINYTSKKILQYSIVLLGLTFNLSYLLQVGKESLLITILTIITAFISMFIFAKIMKTDFTISSLIGVGTAICGGSAIAALSPVIKAGDREISYSMSVIFLFNMIAAFSFPPIGHILNLSNSEFGLWAGTAINDTSSVLAAGFEYSTEAGDYATVVKLGRTLFIIPIVAFFSFISIIKNRNSSKISIKSIVPWFILWFILAVILATIFKIPADISHHIKNIGKFMTAMALGAIGLKTDFNKLIESGPKPLLLGLLVWISVILSSLMIIT